MWYTDEIRLGFLLLLNAIVLLPAWRLTRRWTGDPVQRLVDTLLLWFAVQYAAICLPGVLHVLSVWTMAGVAILLGAGMEWASRFSVGSIEKSTGETPMPPVFLVAGIFVAAISWGVIDKQAFEPIVDSDAMTYHMPAAVHWLQTGGIGLFPVWFFNPANTFSPLAGSTFIAWLIAPLGNDVLARAVQWPALWLLFLASLQLGRAVGLPSALVALVAVAVAVSRPFNSELMSARDDVFLAAFIAVALAGCGGDVLRDRFSPWRLGLAIGLAAATKYTFLFAAPVLLLAIDAPIKAGWNRRRWAIAIGTAILIAGPWYLRNLWLTGNPLYPVELKLFGHPVLRGLFETRRSDRFATWAGLRDALIYGFHSPPPLLLIALLAGWLAAIVGWFRSARQYPLVRACLFGFPLALSLFLLKSPYSEVRFLFPALVTVFIAAGLGINRWGRWPAIKIGLAASLAVVSLATSFKALEILEEIVTSAILITAITLGLIWVIVRLARKYDRVKIYATVAIVFPATLLIYVQWHAYVVRYQLSRSWYYSSQYPNNASAWQFIFENVPADAKLAYTNSYFVYPLYGEALLRRVVYVPVRAETSDFQHLPRFGQPVSGDQIVNRFSDLLNEHPDREEWIRRLLNSGAGYLYVVRDGPSGEPPEAKFAEEDPAHFTRLFKDATGSIYRVGPSK